MNDDFLDKKLLQRMQEQAFRTLKKEGEGIDFCSNDYLGLVRNQLTSINTELPSGSTGSRLLRGNHPIFEETESFIAAFHRAESGLIFNSGYDANTGLLSSVPQRGDTILYDYLSHASIREGVRLSFAQSFSFLHNNLQDLEKKLSTAAGNIFVVTESVFSMDGDIAPLAEMAGLCEKYHAHLIVDEAHATGVVGETGEGVVQALGLEQRCFARIHTFGKAIGAHGAIVLGSSRLRDFLINFSRPFIYTTALPPGVIAAVQKAYQLFPGMKAEREHLQYLINEFQSASLTFQTLPSNTPIQSILVPGNEAALAVAASCRDNGLDLRAILYPTIPLGQERLRVVLHSFNTKEELKKLLDLFRIL